MAEIRRRAVREEQKEERRQMILDIAWRLYQKQTYETLTMAGVAEVSGLAKGTLFLYFHTKEALFLALLEQQLEGWFAEVDGHLNEKRYGIEDIVEMLTRMLEARPGLTRLLAILHTLLEQNIDLETAHLFKQMLLQHFMRTGALLEIQLPFLHEGQGVELLLQCDALVIGFWHLADSAPVIQQALQEPELAMFKINFSRAFSSTLRALLYGLEELAKKEIEK